MPRPSSPSPSLSRSVKACPGMEQEESEFWRLTGLTIALQSLGRREDSDDALQRLKALEPQFRQVAEEAKAHKKAVATRGYNPGKIRLKEAVK